MKNIKLLSAGFIAMAVLLAAAPSFVQAATLTRQLQQGDSGSDVGTLQTYLAQDATIYPQGLVTNYFGTLTTSAVSNFQAANGLPTVGRVGPATLLVLNAKMSGMGAANAAAAIFNPNVNVNTNTSAWVSWSTNKLANGVVYYSSAPLTTYENANSVNISGQTAMTDTSVRNSQNVALTGLQPNTTYYYAIYTTDQNGNVSMTWPSTFHTNQ